MLRLRKVKLLFTFLLVAIAIANASKFKPVVTNYAVAKQLKDAGIQNWGCTQGRNGEMYFANNRGMLIFDGYRWEIAVIPGNIVIRSVFADGDSVFVGSYEEFGYFKKDAFGKFKYHSFTGMLDGIGIEHEEVWNILKMDGRIFFQSFVSAFVWDGKRLSRIYDEKLHPLYYHNVNGSIYAQVINDGYYLLDKNGGSEWKYRKVLDRNVAGSDIVAALPLKDGKALLCSEKNGLFSFDGKNAVKWPTEIDGLLKAGQINRAVLSRDSTIVLGTILDGIYAVGMDGRMKWHYNIETGLQNNSVLRLFCDRDNNIWAALDNGISLIHTGVPFLIMIPERGEPALGMIYDLEIVDSDMFIASNQGVYKYDFRTGGIALIQGSGGQNWHVSQFGKQIFAGNNRNTLESIDHINFPAINNGSSSSTCLIRCRINEQDILLESSYSTFRIYRYKNGKWQYSNDVDGFIAPIRQVEVDHSGTVWAANMNRGIYRIELSNDLSKVASVRYFKSLSDSTPTINYIMKIRGRIVFSDNRMLYIYDDLRQKIVPYKKLNEALASTGYIHYATPIDDRNCWLSGKDGYTLVRFDNDKFITVYYIPTGFFGLENNENNNKVIIHDHVAYFNLNNAVARLSFDSGNFSGENKRRDVLALSKAYYMSDDGEDMPLPIAGITGPVEVKGNISLQFSYPNYDSHPIKFRFILSGKKDLTVVKSTPDIAFHDLKL